MSNESKGRRTGRGRGCRRGTPGPTRTNRATRPWRRVARRCRSASIPAGGSGAGRDRDGRNRSPHGDELRGEVPCRHRHPRMAVARDRLDDSHGDGHREITRWGWFDAWTRMSFQFIVGSMVRRGRRAANSRPAPRGPALPDHRATGGTSGAANRDRSGRISGSGPTGNEWTISRPAEAAWRLNPGLRRPIRAVA